MHLPIEFWIYASVIIGTAIGYCAASVLYRVKRSKIERESWNAARVFYTRSQDGRATRL